jgi:hypothetical protein
VREHTLRVRCVNVHKNARGVLHDCDHEGVHARIRRLCHARGVIVNVSAGARAGVLACVHGRCACDAPDMNHLNATVLQARLVGRNEHRAGEQDTALQHDNHRLRNSDGGADTPIITNAEE